MYILNLGKRKTNSLFKIIFVTFKFCLVAVLLKSMEDKLIEDICLMYMESSDAEEYFRIGI